MTEQTQPTDAAILDAADDFRSQYKHGGTTFDEFDALGFARAVLAKWGTPAGAGEVVAWLVPHLHTFKGATKVHFTRAPGCTMTNVELMEDLEGRVMWLPSTFSDSPGVTDKFGVHHKPKPLFTSPQPTQAQAGAVVITTDPDTGQCVAVTRQDDEGRVLSVIWQAPEAQAGAVPLTFEQARAIREGELNASSEGYFGARSKLDTNRNHNLFKAGFERGWDAREDLYAKE